MATIPSWIDGKWTLLQQLNACIDRIEYLKTITATKEEVNVINTALTNLSNIVNTLENEMVTEADLVEINTALTNLSNIVNTLENEMVTEADLVEINTTLTNLSTTVATLSGAVTTLQNKRDGLTDFSHIDLIQENGAQGTLNNNKIYLSGILVATRNGGSYETKDVSLFLPIIAGSGISFEQIGQSVRINTTGGGGNQLYMHTTKFYSGVVPVGWVQVVSINSYENSYLSNQDVFTHGGVINGAIFTPSTNGIMYCAFSDYQGNHYTIGGVNSVNGTPTYEEYILNEIPGNTSTELRISSDIVEEL